MTDAPPLDLRAHLDAVLPGAPEAKTAILLVALLETTRGDRDHARGLLERIHRDRAFPEYMASLAAHFLAKYEEYAGTPIMIDHPAFDDLVCHTVDRFAPVEVGAPLAELLFRRFLKGPSDPLAALFALLSLTHAASTDEASLVEERGAVILKVYPGSKYEARARLARLRLLRLGISEAANRLKEERTKIQPEAYTARRDALRAKCTALVEATDACLKRFAHLPFVRADLTAVADTLERLDTPELLLKFLSAQSERLLAYPEGADLHLRFVMHHAQHAPAEETFARAREHLDLFPASRHRAWMHFLRGQYLASRDDPASFQILRAVVAERHETWSDLAEEEALAWVRSRRGVRDPEWLLPRLEPLAEFPFTGERLAEFLYLKHETLKEAAIRWPAARRLPALDRVVIAASDLRERFPDSRYAGLAEATADEIRRGDIERAISINQLSNRLIVAVCTSYAAFFLYTATLYPNIWENWIFWIQTISITLVVSLFLIMKYLFGMF